MPWKTASAVAIGLIAVGFAVYLFALNEFIKAASSHFVAVNPDTQLWCNASQGTGIEHLDWGTCGEWFQTLEERPETCGRPCYDKSLLFALRDFQNNNTNGVKVVHFTSRTGPGFNGPLEVAHLTGWWLPAPDEFQNAPRVVIQHGSGKNAFDERMVLASYLFRSRGFGTLLNNLRYRCDPEYLEATEAWGHAYPYDLLGAWDYAVEDPVGHLGGPREPQQVGLIGASMGGFVVALAFGLEGRIPAAALDNTVYSPRDAFVGPPFRKGLEETLGFATPDWLFLVPAYNFLLSKAKWVKGINLEENLPEDVLPMGPDRQRSIYLSANKRDEMVSWENTEAVVNLLEDYPEKYDVTYKYYDDDRCSAAYSNHVTDMLRETETYTAEYCKFWKKVFGLSDESC